MAPLVKAEKRGPRIGSVVWASDQSEWKGSLAEMRQDRTFSNGEAWLVNLGLRNREEKHVAMGREL